MYILRELSQHKLAYAILAVILVAGIAAYQIWGNTVLQERIIIVALAISYFMWGVAAHVKTAHLTKYVVQEYAAMAALGGLLLLLLTF